MIITNDMSIEDVVNHPLYRFTLPSIAIDEYSIQNNDGWYDDRIICITATADHPIKSMEIIIQPFLKNDRNVIIIIDTRSLTDEQRDVVKNMFEKYNNSVDENKRFAHVTEKEWGIYFMRKHQEK